METALKGVRLVPLVKKLSKIAWHLTPTPHNHAIFLFRVLHRNTLLSHNLVHGQKLATAASLVHKIVWHLSIVFFWLKREGIDAREVNDETWNRDKSSMHQCLMKRAAIE